MKKLIPILSLFALAFVPFISGCDETHSAQGESDYITENYANKLTKAVPYPLMEMTDSTERTNLRERLLRFNNPNKIGYLYELTQNGQVIASFTVRGKVSSTQSQLTNTQTISERYNYGMSTIDTMSDDGSYGPNEDGIFFFTTSGVMVQWNGLYQYSDAPLNLTSKPLLMSDTRFKK